MKTTSILLTLSTILFGSAFATEASATQLLNKEVEMAYPYVSLGLGPAPIPLPVFGGGYRVQHGHHGWDSSLNVATIYSVTAVKASALYHYYFKPNPLAQFYTGVGPAVGAVFCHRDHTRIGGAAEFAFGKQYTNNTGDIRYFQADFDFPIVFNKKPYVIAFPIVVLKYGIGF